MPKKDPLKGKKIFVGFNSAGASGIYTWTRILKKRGYKIDFYGRKKIKFDMPVDVFLPYSDNKFIAQLQQTWDFFKILITKNYDIWHFNSLHTFFAYPVNLLILKFLGKKIIHTYRGSEIRLNFDFLPKSLFSKKHFQEWPEYYRNKVIQRNILRTISNLSRRIKMRFFQLIADKIIIIGPFLSSSVNNYDSVIPYSREIGKPPKFKNKKKLVIVHCPTSSEIKGTEYIAKAFRVLAKQYPEHEFIITDKMPHSELQKILDSADIIIDQLLVGWYGGLAVEAMGKGKIVLAYIHRPYLNLVPYGSEIPVVNTSPWTIKNDLKAILDAPKVREDLARRGYKFVKKYHNSEKIAEDYLKIYQELSE